MTGRGFGPCGNGMRMGSGRGFGLGCRRQVAPTKDEEKKILEAELKQIGLERQEIEKRLKELK